jgi:nucleoid DNA-binding protein
MTRADLITILMNTELDEHRNLTREQARAVVSEIFEAIAEALRNGEDAHLPVGSFSVQEQSRKPIRRWILKRNRLLYKQRYVIKFKGDKYDLEPATHRQPPHTLDSKGEMKPSEINSPPKISPAARRKLVAIGIKAGKSRRLIARELNVTATTIARDLELLGITANKKPIATRRKPAVIFKVAPQHPAKPRKPAPRIKGIRPRPVLPRRVAPAPLRPEPPKPSGPVKPLSPEQLRRQHLEEMLLLVESWLIEQKYYYSIAERVLDKARIRLTASGDHYVRGLHESPMSAQQLRDSTRPPEMDSARGTYRTEEVCALWLAGWLAAWAPKDEQLRNQVLNRVRALVTAR